MASKNTVGPTSSNVDAFQVANRETVRRLVRGLGPDDVDPKDGLGACIVFNIACTHIPALCGKNAPTEPYKNAYDVGNASKKRIVVDEAIEAAIAAIASTHAKTPPLKKENIYFGAVETSGTGVRFYGDMCLVLKVPRGSEGRPAPDIYILDRNSYDVVREPAASQIANASNRIDAADWLRLHMGVWSKDLERFTEEKVVPWLPSVARRWTTGQIAALVLQDEDYIEVLYPNSFSIDDLLEVRGSPVDAAAETDISIRVAAGEVVPLHELEWQLQRREARRSLADAGIRQRGVTTHGRIKK